MKNTISIMMFVSLLVLLYSCAGNKPAKDTATQDNQLSEAEKKEGWSLLFNGQSLDGWHLYNKGKSTSCWQVQNGALVCNPETGLEHGDLVTDADFENFELQFDWTISEGGNSGVFINVVEQPGIPTAWASGPEYQLLETSHPDDSIPVKKSGSLFGLAAPINAAPLNTMGEWNHSRIKQVNGKIEFYLNNILTAQQDLKSSDWQQMIAKTHFSHFPQFGKYTKGRIGLQQWLKGVSFKNIKVKGL